MGSRHWIRPSAADCDDLDRTGLDPSVTTLRRSAMSAVPSNRPWTPRGRRHLDDRYVGETVNSAGEGDRQQPLQNSRSCGPPSEALLPQLQPSGSPLPATSSHRPAAPAHAVARLDSRPPHLSRGGWLGHHRAPARQTYRRHARDREARVLELARDTQPRRFLHEPLELEPREMDLVLLQKQLDSDQEVQPRGCLAAHGHFRAGHTRCLPLPHFLRPCWRSQSPGLLHRPSAALK